MARIFSVCLVAVMSCSCAQVGAQGKMFKQGKQVGRIQSKQLDEISGIAVSRKNPGVFWVHNDSGGKAQIYAINVRGHLLSTFLVTGAKARDWEDIAIGPGPQANQSYLYIADIGDNKAKQKTVTVYRVPEPMVSLTQPVSVDRTAKADAIKLKYPDRPRDAETLLVDPLTKDLYIISKRELTNKVYRAPYPQSTEDTTTLQFKATLGTGLSVGGDISAHGRFVVVRSALGAVLFERVSGKPLWEAFKKTPRALPVKSEPQGEAIAFDIEGRGYYTVSEGKKQPIYYYERIKAAD
ncbi:MAG: hypothetical protein HQ515_20045 [Phycisphaeraceae bacterium]|nr:hypothetical protein [Phycisphaeraceae bacterium]